MRLENRMASKTSCTKSFVNIYDEMMINPPSAYSMNVATTPRICSYRSKAIASKSKPHKPENAIKTPIIIFRKDNCEMWEELIYYKIKI